MLTINRLDDIFYKYTYIDKDYSKAQKLWDEIKDRPAILKEATKVVRNKWNTKDIVQGQTICSTLLYYSFDIDKKIYQNFINKIYSNKDIARTMTEGYITGGYTYLLMSLFNPNLVLNEKQKKFAVKEAMNKEGTVLYESDYDKIDHKASVHGNGVYDIRYQILKNKNWNNEEKQKLVYDFYADYALFDEYLEAWEWGIVDRYRLPNNEEILDKDYLYYYSEDMLFEILGDKKLVSQAMKDINFCRLMRSLRPIDTFEHINDHSHTR